MLFENCPRCTTTTTRDEKNNVTCPKCHLTWAPIDQSLIALAIQITETNKATINTLEVTNQLGKQLETHSRILQQLNTRITKLEEKK